MLGNITLVYPLERLYNPRFHKQWERTVERIKRLSPGDLEEMDEQIKKLGSYYEFSGIKKISVSLGTYPDEYSSKIKRLRGDLCEIIARKFRSISRQIYDLIGDPDCVSDFDDERKKFDESLVTFRMLRAFYKRWKLDSADYRYVGEQFDFAFAIKDLAFKLAKKRMLLMKEYTSMKKVVDYRQRTKVLDEISYEVSFLFDWYRLNYLNLDSRNSSWIGSDWLDDADPWMPVNFLDSDPGLIPMERFRKIPSKTELSDVHKLFERFVGFYRQHELLGADELDFISDFALFKEYAANFSLYSEDAAERLKAGLMRQMLTLHKVVRDAKERVNLKQHTELMLQNSFAMYFAPIDEIYSILQKGFISSDSIFSAKGVSSFSWIILRKARAPCSGENDWVAKYL